MTAPLALLGDIGGPELLLVMFLILLLFGGEKLPQLARGLGKSVREFKKVTSEAQNEIKRAIDDAPEPTVRRPRRRQHRLDRQNRSPTRS